MHVNVGNEVFANRTGIPIQMTCLGTKLQQQGYRTVFAGKVRVASAGERPHGPDFPSVTLQSPNLTLRLQTQWHAGMAYPQQTPRGRGYAAALTYFNPDND